VAKSPADDMQLENPFETGSLPAESNADSTVVEIGGNMSRDGGKSMVRIISHGTDVEVRLLRRNNVTL
jgi:hypothetical protein